MNSSTLQWVYDNSGPILRYLCARDFPGLLVHDELPVLRQAMWQCAEVTKWLNLLGDGPVHHSVDNSLENLLFKLTQFGLERYCPDFDARCQQIIAKYIAGAGGYTSSAQSWKFHAMNQLMAFLIMAGYGEYPDIQQRIRHDLQAIHETAVAENYRFYLDADELEGLPKAWVGKNIYRPEFSCHNARLPNLQFLRAWNYLPQDADTSAKLAQIVGYFIDPRFQHNPKAYGWDREKRSCWSGSRAHLTGFFGFAEEEFEPGKLIFQLEVLAAYPVARQSEWYTRMMAHLEEFKTARGSYQLPASYLVEAKSRYYFHGARMGLGESRRSKTALELEGTFRIYRLLGKDANLT